MNILLKPVITEKMSRDGEDFNRYGFVVPRNVNKVEIKNAVESMYGVTVKSVNTMVTPGKSKSRYTKRGVVQGSTSTVKKAVVTLVDGDIIDFYSSI
ncbi:MAG: 50S ribosomal protein L23 [Crocinitomicaceae bacterium]|nr:50S ribosomal protein L23 [Crocinitomicaceae bacterium]|tara:strand:- start:16931 stop:17221 length:291 start_codon:yes stop_codon:yes gene_type:complete